MSLGERHTPVVRGAALMAGLVLLTTAAGIKLAAAEESPQAGVFAVTDERIARRDAVIASIKAAGVTSYAVGINPASGRIGATLFTNSDGTTQDDDDLALVLGSDVDVQKSTGSPAPTTGFKGGTRMENGEPDEFTAGFAVKVGSKHGFVTASHVFQQDEPADQQEFEVGQAEATGTGYQYANLTTVGHDWGIITIDDSPGTHQARPFVTDAIGADLPVTSVTTPTDGAEVCTNGIVTGVQCGDVTLVSTNVTLSATFADDGSIEQPAWVLLNAIQTNICLKHGDSGGPLFVDNGATAGALGINAASELINGECMSTVGKPNIAWHTQLSDTPANTTNPANAISVMTG